MLKNTFTGYNSVTTFIRSDVVASQICKMLQNSPKIRTYSSSRSSKVIDLGANQKHICNFPLVINRNYGCISYCFPRYWRILLINSLFSTPHPCLMPPSKGTLYNINVIYTLLKSTFSGLQFHHWQYRSYLHSFSHCCLPNLRYHIKFRENYDLQAVGADTGTAWFSGLICTRKNLSANSGWLEPKAQTSVEFNTSCRNTLTHIDSDMPAMSL